MILPNKRKHLIYVRRNTLVTGVRGRGLPPLTVPTHFTLLASSQLAPSVGTGAPTPHGLEDRQTVQGTTSCASRIPSPHLDKTSLTASQQPKPVWLHIRWPFCRHFYKVKHILFMHLLLTLRCQRTEQRWGTSVVPGGYMQLQRKSRRHSFCLVSKNTLKLSEPLKELSLAK